MKNKNKKSGFTLVEVLVSVGIILVFLPFAASMLTNSQLLASYSKHKIQAAYAAQQIIETQRQEPISYFAPYLATTNPMTTPTIAQVVLDTKGNYNNTNCATNTSIACGTATVTIASKVYINSAGQKNYPPTATYSPPSPAASYTYYTIAHVTVQISWWEQVINIKVPMNEYYATDIIVNDTMLN